jgi:hypothetical protein
MLTCVILILALGLFWPTWVRSDAPFELQPRSDTELQRMDQRALAYEAATACAHASIAGAFQDLAIQRRNFSQAQQDSREGAMARAYLARIGEVITRKTGLTPEWLVKLKLESWRASTQPRCLEIMHER